LSVKGPNDSSTPFLGTLKPVASSAWRSASCRSSPKQPTSPVLASKFLNFGIGVDSGNFARERFHVFGPNWIKMNR
jgi:hypothetical protein